MKKNYVKRGMLLLGAAAICGSAYAQTYTDVTRKYIKDPTFVTGWQGVIGAADGNVAETWSSAFKTYQNLGEMPAGKYVLTVDAFYRCGNNDYAKANQAGNPDLNTAYIFINDAKVAVKGLWEGRETAPNSMGEANEAFIAGEYKNSVEYDHKGGELIIGIANTGCYHDEWCCFDNFVLTCDGAPIAIENGDFSAGLDAKRAWNNVNSANSEKTPDVQKDNSGGGDYRKCNGSPYNTGQQVELPAGTYRFSMACFHRYGSTLDADGVYYSSKWPMSVVETPFGSLARTPKDWFTANDYDKIDDVQYSHAYIYMSKNEAKPKILAWDDSESEGDLVNGVDVRTRVKDSWEICNGDLAAIPQNNPQCGPADKDPAWEIPYEQKNKCTTFNDSGSEREAGAAFVADPEKWRQGVEFTLTEPTKVWLGFGKDNNTGDQYWHAYGYITLETIEGAGINDIITDNALAPVEYYNVQGMKVNNPAKGQVIIVKQGNQIGKRIF